MVIIAVGTGACLIVSVPVTTLAAVISALLLASASLVIPAVESANVYVPTLDPNLDVSTSVKSVTV